MSFVNLLANDIWSEADIVRRTESMVRSEFSQEAETILNRKVLGASLGTYTISAEEQADLERYNVVVLAAQAEGVAARADMALLLQVFPLEDAKRRLDRMSLTDAWDRLQLPVVDPIVNEDTGEVVNQLEVQQDIVERSAAQNVIYGHTIEDQDGSTMLDPVAVDQDVAERTEAQDVIDNAPANVKSLFDLRNT